MHIGGIKYIYKGIECYIHYIIFADISEIILYFQGENVFMENKGGHDINLFFLIKLGDPLIWELIFNYID